MAASNPGIWWSSLVCCFFVFLASLPVPSRGQRGDVQAEEEHCQDGLGLPCSRSSWNTQSWIVADNLAKWIADLQLWMPPNDPQSADNFEAGNAGSCYSEEEVSFLSLPTDDQLQKLDQMSGPNGQISLNDGQVKVQAAFFNKGSAQGLGTMTVQHPDGGKRDSQMILYGQFVNGCLEGRVQGLTYLIDDDLTLTNDTVISLVAHFSHGVPEPPIWKPVFTDDGVRSGFYYFPDRQKKSRNYNNFFDLGGEDVVFIYPDMKTAVRGSFDQKGLFLEAKQVEIVAERTNQFGIKELQFSQPFGPTFEADLGTQDHLSSRPLLQDPYESGMVEVKPSSLSGAGEGLFLKQTVKANTTVSYFNGMRLNKVFSWNPFDKPSVYLVETSDESGNSVYLNIPMDQGSADKYSASAAHKVNHAKDPNSAYSACLHPRFGRILCLFTLKDLDGGEELFTEYDVSFDHEGLKTALKALLNVGQWYTGQSRKEFVGMVKPYLEVAAKIADKVDVDTILKLRK